MKRFLLAALGVFVVLGAIIFWRGEAMYMGWRAQGAEKQSLAAIKTLLAPHIKVTTPPGPGPHPVVLQFHGCAGARLAFQEMYAKVANEAGYAAVIVDSNRPRELSREAALEKVCTAKLLIGIERAGDVLAAIDLVRDRDDLDTSNLVLTGWSHGAWTIMDFLSMDVRKAPPASVDAPYSGKPIKVAGAALFYPYCGFGARSRRHWWTQENTEILSSLAGADTIVNHTECISLLNKISTGNKLPLDQKVYPDTEHAFDDPFIESDWQHWHHPAHMRDALARYRSFLSTLYAQDQTAVEPEASGV
ncbi:MAG: dienelactone hydrolase family protein [Pseudomonadota bacterium]